MTGFINYLPELFAGFGSINVRKMFGGYGVYHQGLMFGLVINDTLYLKADGENLHFFTQNGLAPFTYMRNGKPTELSYRQAPDELLDDQDIAALWASRSYAAAIRGKAAGKSARKSRPATDRNVRPRRSPRP